MSVRNFGVHWWFRKSTNEYVCEFQFDIGIISAIQRYSGRTPELAVRNACKHGGEMAAEIVAATVNEARNAPHTTKWEKWPIKKRRKLTSGEEKICDKARRSVRTYFHKRRIGS
jgi:hypothetical protein